jgi:hypothetical protein
MGPIFAHTMFFNVIYMAPLGLLSLTFYWPIFEWK